MTQYGKALSDLFILVKAVNEVHRFRNLSKRKELFLSPAIIEAIRQDITGDTVVDATKEEDEETELLLNLTKETKPKLASKSAAIPASKINRLFRYAGLAAGLGGQALGEQFKRFTGYSQATGNVLYTEKAMTTLVDTLTKMRGAALKLGQMLSLQDNELIPEEVLAVFERVRNGAYAMPDWQLEKVLVEELGPEWKDKFVTFDATPCAAASIGQVHRGRILDEEGQQVDVAIKIQYPGVATSISSDIAHLGQLLSLGSFLPKGLFLDNTLRVMQTELDWEVDYIREATWTRWFNSHLNNLAPQVFGGVRTYALKVPKVFDALSTSRILTLSWLPGVPLSDAHQLSQAVRDRLGTTILALCLHEIFHLGVMQTDPNWANFLFDGHHISLLDFGATRQFNSETFLTPYRRLVHAAAANDSISCWQLSVQLGFLTGDESPRMRESHLNSLLLLGAPFRTPVYDFAEHAKITREIKASIPIMLAERLCPPPDDAYALHRKLSGAFLLCARLRARVPCQAILQSTIENPNKDKE